MTFHATPSRPAAGHKPNQRLGHKTSPRLAVSFTDATLAAISTAAAEQGIPTSQIVREAVEQYLVAHGVLSAEA